MAVVDTPSLRPDSSVALTDRLLGAAIDVFTERGLEKAGVAAIARRAGVTTGAIYARWSGKQELLLDALDVVMEAQLARLLKASPDASATAVLENLGDELTDRNSATDALMMEAVATARRDPEFRVVFTDRLADQEAHLLGLIERGKADGVIDPTLSTHAIVSLCHAISFGFMVLSGIEKPLPVAHEWQAVIHRLVAAALPPNPPTESPSLAP